MPEVIRLTERDEDIIGALASRIRLASQRQASDHWFDGDDSNTRRRMSHLQEIGMVEKVAIRARTLPPIEHPLIKWQPGDKKSPDCAKVAYACRSRWYKRPVRTCTAYIATEKAAQLFGGRHRNGITKELQVTHDLGVTAIWLFFDRAAPQWADAWRGEDFMAASKEGDEQGGWQYRFNVFRMDTNSGSVEQRFVPSDITDLVKLARVLAYAIADDGCLSRDLKDDLRRLSACLYEVLFANWHR